MSSDRTRPRYTPAEFAALMDEAKAGAIRARREALDAFLDRLFRTTRPQVVGSRVPAASSVRARPCALAP